MEIWECILEAYNEGQLFLPPFMSQGSRYNVEAFLETFNPTLEQKQRFEQLLNEFCIDVENHGFHAGMKMALRLLSE